MAEHKKNFLVDPDYPSNDYNLQEKEHPSPEFTLKSIKNL